MQSSSLLTVRLHRLNFYVVLRKLISKLQAFPESIQETPMVRFYSSIYADDKMLIGQMSCDGAFHGIPHHNRCRTLNEDRMRRQRLPINNVETDVLPEHRRRIAGEDAARSGLMFVGRCALAS